MVVLKQCRVPYFCDAQIADSMRAGAIGSMSRHQYQLPHPVIWKERIVALVQRRGRGLNQTDAVACATNLRRTARILRYATAETG